MTLRNRIIAVISAIVFFVLVGTTTATALWSTTASVGASVKAANLAASCGSTAMLNASFEDPVLAGTLGYANDGEMTGWRAKDAAGNPVRIEIWRGYDGVPAGTGDQHVELNADVPGTLFQTLDTVPGQTLQWSLMHRGRSGTDTMQLLIGAENVAGVSQGDFSDDNTAWRRYSGAYVVPAGQTRTTLAFKAVSAAGGASIGNFLDDVSFGSGPCLASANTVANITNPGGIYRPGDTVEYTSVVTNTGSSFSQGTLYEAVVPAGLTYTAGSITINGATRTDALADDTANYVSAGTKVVARLGTGATTTAGGTIAQNTQTVTVKFRAVIPAASAGTTINLTPSVTYANGLASGWALTATSNTVTYPVAIGADLAVTVAATPANVQKATTNTTVTWTVTVTNNGPLSSGANGTVTIAIPNTGVASTAVPTTAAGATCAAISGGQSVCTITAAMAAGATRTFTITRSVAAASAVGATFTLTATAGSSVTDPVAGNNSANSVVSVVDTIVPTTPGTPTATKTATSAVVSWTGSTDANGIAGYDLYRNGVLYQSLGTVTSYNDTGLTAWTTYTYQVRARDLAANVSALSGTLTVIVPIDTTNSYQISDSRCLVASNTSGNGTLTASFTCGASANQRDWTFQPTNGGFTYITTGPNSRSWTVAATGTAITVTPAVGSNSQEWKVIVVGATYQFESRARPGLCVDQNGGTVSLLACNTADASQTFDVIAR